METFTLEELQKRLKAKQDLIDKAKEADYGYEERDIETLQMITGSERDVCVDIIKTIQPDVSQGRLELAMNIILGGDPLGEDGWWDGYEVGRYEYELGKEEKRVKPQLDALLAKKEKLESNLAAAAGDDGAVDAKPLVWFGAPESWEDAPCGFASIQSSKSQLILLGENGLLYCWSWSGRVRGIHPRALELCPEQQSNEIHSAVSS